ncbi:putative NmrA family transcriptional regulator [Wilcoxina mikolae CBS 423.85]|nr:putative NmrA family transcriptional regulator [Wilcoxina mikolae CBS 423.85]
MSKLLTVFGATGTQGGSVIRTILSHPVLSQQFRLRAITRDPSKPSSLALQTRGVEVVKADLNNKHSLITAISGSHSVFAVTNFWETISKSTEIQQGRNIADVSAETGVEHLIWSTLPHVTKLTEGKLPNVPHFDGKAEVDEYIRNLGIPMTSFVPGFYMSNLPGMMPKGEDGTYTLSWPVPGSTKFPLFSPGDDTGKFVSSILLRREEMLGGRVFGASGWWSGEEVVETFQRVTGEKAVYKEVPGDVWKSFLPEAVAQEMLENFLLVRDYKYFGPGAEEGVEMAVGMLEEKPVGLEEFLKKKGAW